MNQRGNEPMIILHVRIPSDVLVCIDSLAAQSSVTRSEYIRQLLEFAKTEGIVTITQMRYNNQVNKTTFSEVC